MFVRIGMLGLQRLLGRERAVPRQQTGLARTWPGLAWPNRPSRPGRRESHLLTSAGIAEARNAGQRCWPGGPSRAQGRGLSTLPLRASAPTADQAFVLIASGHSPCPKPGRKRML